MSTTVWNQGAIAYEITKNGGLDRHGNSKSSLISLIWNCESTILDVTFNKARSRHTGLLTGYCSCWYFSMCVQPVVGRAEYPTVEIKYKSNEWELTCDQRRQRTTFCAGSACPNTKGQSKQTTCFHPRWPNSSWTFAPCRWVRMQTRFPFIGVSEFCCWNKHIGAVNSQRSCRPY